MISIIASDMDGTLLNDKMQVSDGNMTAIKAAQDAGIEFVVATGRSDYPNQINNVLVFPGLFRGLLDAGARDITVPMLRAAAEAIASVVSDEELNPAYIVPGVFDPRIAELVSAAVRGVARAEGRDTLMEAALTDPRKPVDPRRV